MKTTLTVLGILIFYLSGYSQSITPSVINSSGNTFTGGFYSFDWSVGEIALITTMDDAEGKVTVTNGFFQPDKSAKDLSDKNAFAGNEITILPNPTPGQLQIVIDTKQQGSLSIVVYDASGRKIHMHKVISVGSSTTQKINLTGYSSGTYLLHISLQPAPGSIGKHGSYRIVKI
jgi:membrane-bound inhibitor of C-type lysozyme